MFNITDTELGLAMRYRRDVDSMTRDAQRIVDRQDASIDALRAALRAVIDERDTERAGRLAAEHELKRMKAFLDSVPLN